MPISAPLDQQVRPEARWLLPSIDPEAQKRLEKDCNLPRAVAQVLVARGLTEVGEVGRFLTPGLELLHDPFSMRGMEAAVNRVLAAIRDGEQILLYGDYDVDGTTAIVVLKMALEILGARVQFHVPHRLNEGYGMRGEVISDAAAAGTRLVISVDTGIRACAVVQHAKELGLDVIVTDHHLPDTELPPALAVLNPSQPGCDYPNKHLCGAGVAFKLVQALFSRSELPQARQTGLLESFLKPVAIATVADIVPLVGENRAIVQRGLSGLKQVRNHGLRSLLEVAGFEPGDCPSAHQVAFRLAPRINAAGRMANAAEVIELFLTQDPERARSVAQQLDLHNQERQRTESAIVEQIVQSCSNQEVDTHSSALVFAAPDWHLGVLGIVASRLVERFCRPVFVLSNSGREDETEDQFTGSGRSIPAFHLLEALESMPALFKKFGGHRQAAGLTLSAEQIPEFRRQFAAYAASRLSADDMRPAHSVDAEITFSEIDSETVERLMSLGPFGLGNPNPLLLSTTVTVAGPAKVIREGKHFSVPLRQNGRLLMCKAWHFGHRAHLLNIGEVLDIVFHIEDNPYSRKRGYDAWCITLKDARKAQVVA